MTFYYYSLKTRGITVNSFLRDNVFPPIQLHWTLPVGNLFISFINTIKNILVIMFLL